MKKETLEKQQTISHKNEEIEVSGQGIKEEGNTNEIDDINVRRMAIKYYSALIVFVLLCVLLFYGNTSIQTTVYEVELLDQYSDMAGYTIVQVSDLHNTNFGTDQKRLIDVIERQKPNIIVITGDIIDSHHLDIGVAMDFINEAITIAPVYFVPGNHEAWLTDTQYLELKQLMEHAGVYVLENEGKVVSYGESSFYIAGLSDPDMTESGSVSPDSVVQANIEKGGYYFVLLAHRPELLEEYATTNAELVLSGHAHGGQIRIPFIGGVVAPNQGFFPEYTEGMHRDGNTVMVVSRGLGNSVIPLRINNRPEIVVVKLVEER